MSKDNISRTSVDTRQRLAELKANSARLEEALRIAQERLTTFMNSATDGFVLLDSSLSIIDINRNVLRRLGLQDKDVIGKKLTQLPVDFNDAELHDKYRDVIKTGRPLIVDNFSAGPKFENVVLNLRAFKVGDGIGIIATNITKRKQAEDALKESERHYRLLAENATDIIWSMDMNIHCTYISPSVTDMLGYTVQEAMRLKIEDVIIAEPLTSVTDVLERKLIAARAGEDKESGPWPVEIELRHRNGSTIWTESTVTFLRNPDGELTGLLGITRDITERRRAQEPYLALADSSPIGIYVVQDGRFQIVRYPQFHQLESYSEDELIGMNPSTLIHPEDRDIVKENVTKMLRGERLSPYEYRLINKNGEVRWIMERVVSIRLRGRQAVLGSFMDVTEQKAAEHEIRRSESQLRLLSRRVIEVQEEERTRISRDLHDQLGQEVVMLKVEAISLAEHLEGHPQLQARANTMVTLLDRLRASFQRIAVSIRPEILDELGLVKAIQLQAEDFERHSGISCPVDAPTTEPHLSKPVATAAYRIFQESITNVLKHAKASQAKVKVSVQNGSVTISVEDDGVGFDLKRLSDASALGLLGMRERARLAGGTLAIRGKLGKGAKVIARFPLESC